MSGTTAANDADVRAMLRLCRTLQISNDSLSRKEHLLSGLCDLLPATSGLSVVANIERIPRRHTILSSARYGSHPLREEQLLANCLPPWEEMCPLKPAESKPRWHPILRPPCTSRGMRLFDCIRYPLAMADGYVMACLNFVRESESAPAFCARERSLLQLTHLEMSWVYESDLLLATRGAPSLSPRQRETLECLLAGLSEKQIAAKLRLSPNTVHHHIKALHRHFGVSSRSELLARWVK